MHTFSPTHSFVLSRNHSLTPLNHSPTLSRTHPPMHASTNSPTYSPTHAHTHPLTTHSRIHSPTRTCTHARTHPPIHSLKHLFQILSHPLTHSNTHSPTHALSLTHSLTHSPLGAQSPSGSFASQKFPAFQGTRRFCAFFTKTRHLSYPELHKSSWCSPIPFLSISIFYHLRLGLGSGLFLSGLPTNSTPPPSIRTEDRTTLNSILEIKLTRDSVTRATLVQAVNLAYLWRKWRSEREN